MDKIMLETIAADLIRSRELALPVGRPSQRGALTLKESYQIARIQIDHKLASGDRIIGAKLGFTSPDLWPDLGLNGPLWAPVFASAYASGGGDVRLPRLRAPEVEPEIVFGFFQADAPADKAEWKIDWLALGLEIIDTGYPKGKPVIPDQAADLCAHQYLIVGEKVPFTESLRPLLADFECELYCNDILRARGKGSNVMGNPTHAADWFVKHLIDVVPWKAGTLPVLTTGRLGPPPAIPDGTSSWEMRSTLPIPGLTVTITREA